MYRIEVEPVQCVANGDVRYEGNWRFVIKLNDEPVAMSNNYLDADRTAAQIEMQIWGESNAG